MGWEDALTYGGIFFTLVIAAFGFPIPEELPIVTAGVLVGHAYDNPDSALYWWIMLPLCIFGVVLCDTILYLIGRYWGIRLFHSPWVRRRVLPDERRARIENNFHKYGIRILLVARLLPGIRTPVFVMAGVMKLPFNRFLLADAIYAIPGVSLFFGLAYWFTESFKRVFDKVEHARPVIVAVVLAGVAGALVVVFLKRRVSTGDPRELPPLVKRVATIHTHIDPLSGMAFPVLPSMEAGRPVSTHSPGEGDGPKPGESVPPTEPTANLPAPSPS